MSRKNNIARSALFLIRSLVLFVLLYLSFFAIGGVAFWYGCILFKHKWEHGYLPYDLPSVLPVILLFGSLLLIFKMIGSLSAIQKINRPDLKEIKRVEHPQLFQLIDETADYMRISPPRKVYFSSTVSASVFLKTGFRNMFFPSEKYLEIGVGLINILNQEELRAVLAHEFGHFSQKSTKLNKPVYAIGQSIGYLLKKIKPKKRGVVEDQYYAFAYIFRSLANGLFSKLSKDFNSLSEALECDADRIAAEYVGKEAIISALLKTSFASQMFSLTLHSIGILANSKKGISNFYAAQNNLIDVSLQINNSSWNNNFINTPLPETRLSELTKKRMKELHSFETSTNLSYVLFPSNQLVNNFSEECASFTQSIYQHQLRTRFSTLDICPAARYRKWIEKHSGQLKALKHSGKEIEIEITLESGLHRIPLTELHFEVYWDNRRLGTGKCKKGFSLKTKTSIGKHVLKIEGQYIKDTPLPIIIEKQGKHIVRLDYEHFIWKAEYRFSIKETDVFPQNSLLH